MVGRRTTTVRTSRPAVTTEDRVAPNGVVTFRQDGDLRFTEVRVVGRGLGHDWVGRTDAEVLEGEVRSRVMSLKQAVLADGRARECVVKLPLGRTHRTFALRVERDQSSKAGLIGSLADITRAAEVIEERDRMRQLQDVSHDYGYVVRVIPGGKIEFEWTAAGLYQSTEYTLREIRRRGGWPALIHPDDLPTLMAEIGQITDGQVHRGEFRMVTRSGKIRWLSNNAKLLAREPGEETLRIVGAARDITEQRLAEDEARRLQQQLTHVARLSTMGEMASGIAHELNQPLTAIVNHADACSMALRGSGTGDAATLVDLETIAHQAARAGDIIRRLRSLVAKRDPTRVPVDVNACVRDVLRLEASEAKARRVMLELSLGDIGLVMADTVQVQQVILNLVRNAIEAVMGMPEPRRRVRVSTVPRPSEVEFVVRDWGPEVEAGAVEGFFEPFYTTKAEGLGMGLPISRTIVENLGGRLHGSPGPDGGMVFAFVLPGV